MDDIELFYDTRAHEFTNDNGYTLHAEFIMLNDTRTVIEEILAGTGIEVDEFFVEILRDTVETVEPRYPFGN